MCKQTLLGATGTGKTFTVANVIAQMDKPALVIAHNKTLAAQLAQNSENFPRRSGSLFRIILRLLSTRGVYAGD